jgi:hypothetical protein
MTRLAFSLVTALLMMSAPLTGAHGIAGAAADDQDQLAAARDLYSSAAYEDALTVLSGLSETNRPVDEKRAIEQYRALCLLALGRSGEAEKAIEVVVTGDPMYRPTAETSPRLRSAFSEVRRRVLPSVIQQQYTRAKAEYDRKEFAPAAAEFNKVLAMLDDPDVAAAPSPALTDLKTLAGSFKDLAVSATPPPPPPPPPTPVELPAAPKPIKVYTPEDTEVVPPVPLRQDLPPFPGITPVTRQGYLEVTIDETGVVQSAMMLVPLSALYDPLALAAARNWRYRPAMLNGTPVKFRKSIQITLKASR